MLERRELVREQRERESRKKEGDEEGAKGEKKRKHKKGAKCSSLPEFFLLGGEEGASRSEAGADKG